MPSKLTGRRLRITKSTRGSSERLGPCEICGKHMSECFLSRVGYERLREDGSTYVDYSGSMVFAHEACIDKLSLSD